MNTLKPFILFFSLWIILLNADRTTAQKNLFYDVKQYMDQRVESKEIAGIFIGVVNQKGEETKLSMGPLRVDDSKAVTKNAIFEIGSISKVFTTLLMAQLMEDQGISLDDEAEKLLPEGMVLPAFKGKKILLRHLVTHTSGLPTFPDNLFPEDSSNPYADYTLEDLTKYLKKMKLNRTPGSQFEYSNIGMALVGHILEAQTGQQYEQLVNERIAQPLHMQSTSIKIPADDSSRLAKAHSQGRVVSNWDLPAFEGAGALRSNGADMLRFLNPNYSRK